MKVESERHTRKIIGRVTQGDLAITFSNHTQAVAGLILSSGQESSAQGMAFQATASIYDWHNFLQEMAAEAASGTILANHSWGIVTGFIKINENWLWFGDATIDQEEDYLFGFYDEQARAFDELAFQYPHFLMVRAAGNDRQDIGPAPGESHYVFENTSISSF